MNPRITVHTRRRHHASTALRFCAHGRAFALLVVSITGCGGDSSPTDASSSDTPDTSDVTFQDTLARDGSATDIINDTEPPDSGRIEVEPIAGPCSQVMIPAAFGWAWEDRNHRIRRIGVMPERADGECTFERVQHAFVGGDFTTGEVDSDNAVVESRWNEVSGEWVSGLVVRMELVIPAGGILRTPVRVAMPEDFVAPASMQAFVSGFIYETDVPQTDEYPADVYPPSAGFTSRGIGIGVDVNAEQPAPSEYLDLELYTRFEHGRAGDDFLRPDLNQAFPFAQSGATVELTIIAAPDDRPVQQASVEYVQESEEPLRFTDELDPPAPPEQRTVALTGWAAAEADTALGITLVDFKLYPSRVCENNRDCTPGDVCESGECAEQFGPPGDYIREISFDTQTNFELEPPELDLNGYSTSASTAVAILPTRNVFSGRVRVLTGQGVRTFQASTTAPAGNSVATLSTDDQELP